jgi:peroxiredoxin
MTIQVGERVPEATLRRMGESGMETVDIKEYFDGRKVVLFAVPGAFTPTCSEKHLPGFLEEADTIRAKGVDAIACVAVNDPFVLKAWDHATGATGRIDIFSDGNAEFTRALGLDFDGSGVGLGTRSRRYAMVVDDGVVKTLLIEEAPSQAETSSAAAILNSL